jgi:hypothetical protein
MIMISLAEQMRLWEQDELHKMQEEGQSPFARGQTVSREVNDHGLDLGRLYEELRGFRHGTSTNLDQVEGQVGAGWRPYEWIRTSVCILEAIGGGHREGWHYVV